MSFINSALPWEDASSQEPATPAAAVPASPVPASFNSAPIEQVKAQPESGILQALAMTIQLNGSDLHIAAGKQAMVRVDGTLRALPGSAADWTSDSIQNELKKMVSATRWEEFQEELELDFSISTSAGYRFRVNAYKQRGKFGAAFRVIPSKIKSLQDLKMPDVIKKFAEFPRGLVLVTGPTGSGKSTTLAALINEINETRADHIMTIEDPIEFIHESKKSLVNQREVGADTHSFNAALKHVLRQDPDVILIGEMRDLETISAALTAAETGHLVFGTLHTQSAAQTIDRIIDVFPPHQQAQIRVQLASTLQGVICQNLIPLSTGSGRAAATEIMFMTPAIQNLIREGKTFQVATALQSGRDLGMRTLDQSLVELVRSGQVSRESAVERAQDLMNFNQLMASI